MSFNLKHICQQNIFLNAKLIKSLQLSIVIREATSLKIMRKKMNKEDYDNNKSLTRKLSRTNAVGQTVAIE